VGQAELVRRGELRAADLVLAAVERIERVDADLHAVVSKLYDAALAACEACAGPFAGVPFLMKDVGAVQAGQPYWAGNRALRDAGHRAEHDSPLGARFRALGLVTVGKSSTPEFGLQSTTQPLAFAPTRNPWAPAYSSGGSSGGACAAVAAGLVPAAHASDGAGSIRIPAAWCGLVGLKPSRGRIAGDPTSIGRRTVEFVVARSLRDTAAFLDLLQGNAPGELFTLGPPRRPYSTELRRKPGPLRVGLLTRAPGADTHPECAAAAEKTARALEALGHKVEEAWPEALFEHEERSLYGLVFGPLEYRSCLVELGQRLGRAAGPEDVEPYLWTLADPEGPGVSALQYLEAVEWLQAWVARVAHWWAEGFDLLLTPTVPEPPVPLDELDGARLAPLDLARRMTPHMAFTEPFNATGQPALSLPLHATPEGLPVGVQLVAALGREDLLFQVAGQLERVFPWRGRRPPVHA
jgi:amidase